MKGSPTRATTVVLSLFLSGVLGGAWAGAALAQRAQDPYSSVDTLVRVMGLIETSYVDPIEGDKLVQAAIDGMLNELDPHSAWMDSSHYRDLQRETHGSYTGIGVEVRVTPEGAQVTRVLPGSPAHREGLEIGDRIVAIDGASLDELPTNLSEVLLGPRGSSATLSVLRDGWDEPVTIETLRDQVHAPSVELQRIDDDLTYVRLRQFQEGSATELHDALLRARDEHGYRAILLDLRDNPGGLLREAVGVTDLFLDSGVIVSTWGRLDSERNEHMATPGGLPSNIEVVVLVNGLSASASEIVAGALQDTGRATLVGERTYGKGSVQTIFEHRDGSALKLTIGRYYTPSGEPVASANGRTPDVVVPWPMAEPAINRLREALATAELSEPTRAELMKIADEVPKAYVKSHPAIPWNATLGERLLKDPQLAAAVGVAREAL